MSPRILGYLLCFSISCTFLLYRLLIQSQRIECAELFMLKAAHYAGNRVDSTEHNITLRNTNCHAVKLRKKKMPQGQCQTYFTIASLRHVYRNISHLKKAIFFSSSNFNFLWLHPFLPGPEQDIKLKKTRSLLLSSSWLGGKTLPRWSHLPIKNTVISRHSCNPLPFTNQRAQWGDI